MGEQVKVCLMEMDDRCRQSISLVLKHRAGNAVVLTDEAEADIALLDLDQNLDKSLSGFRDLRSRKPGFRVIGLSKNADIKFDDALIIKKPLSAGSLLSAIEAISGVSLGSSSVKTASAASSLSSRVSGSRRRVETQTVSEDKIFFEPRDYLLGTVLEAEAEAKKQNMAAVISFYGDRVICIDGKSKLIETNLTSSQARGFAISAVNKDETEGLGATTGLQKPFVEYMSHADAKRKFAGKTYSVPQEIFMWKLGTTTSRGRLPSGFGLEERVYLRRWPNLTRFSYSDNEMRIIAYWMRQAESVREISGALDITVPEVCSVFTAAYATGLAGKARREVDEIWEAPDVSEHKERGLFSSIMKKLLSRKPEKSAEDDE